MTPEMILATIKAGFEFGTELVRYLQTEDGKAFVKKTTEDRAAWDKFWSEAGRGLKGLVSGEMFK